MKTLLSRRPVLALAALLGLGLTTSPVHPQQPTQFNSFKPGGNWLADDGIHIDAHGGNVLFDPKSQRYFWFGEHRGNPRGVGCYSSLDLYNWRNEGVAMTAEEAGLVGMVFERPKVVYNKATDKYVMWYHHDSRDYRAAELGVAVSDKVDGPYLMVRHFRPNNHESRDFGIFTDDDDKVYVFYSADNNSQIRVVELTADYQNITTREVVTGSHCEGEGIMKYRGIYYLLTSGCAGWTPNPATYATAANIMGPWTQKGNPAIGDTNRNTFASQPTFILKVQGRENGFVYMGDRWNGGGSVRSQYVWLPIVIPRDGVMELRWRDEWNLSVFSPASSLAHGRLLRGAAQGGWLRHAGQLFVPGPDRYTLAGRRAPASSPKRFRISVGSFPPVPLISPER